MQPSEVTMKTTILAAGLASILLAPGVLAQTSTTSPLPTPRPGVDGQAPLPGANSFTEEQARARLRDNGYGNPGKLAKGEDGIWRGQAEKDGAMRNVAVDYRGNISISN